MTDKAGRIDRYKHVGMQVVVLDVDTGCSPFVKLLMHADVVPEMVAKVLSEKLAKVFLDRPGVVQLEWGLRPPEVRVHPGTGVIMPKEVEREAREAALRPLRDHAQEAAKERRQALEQAEAREGYYLVEGLRHSALVKAGSPIEAINLASDHVGSWDGPEVHYLGTELPPVLGL